MKVDIEVIVSAYNSVDTINKCIDSLLAQEGKFSYRITIINDGSTDDTLTALKRYQGNDLVTVYSKTNGGLSDARNYGMKIMQADYVVFVDSDDFVEKDFLQCLYSQYENSKCDLAICGYQKEDADGEVRFVGIGQKEVISSRKALDQIFVSTGFEGYAWNKLFKTSIIKDNNLSFIYDSTIEDMYFACEYLLHCNMVSFDPKVVYHYVVHSNSIVNSKKFGSKYDPKSLKNLDTYQKLQKLIPQEYVEVHKSLNAHLCWFANSQLRIIMLASNKNEIPSSIVEQLKNISKKYRNDFMNNHILPKRDKIIYLMNNYCPSLLAFIWKKLKLRGNGF